VLLKFQSPDPTGLEFALAFPWNQEYDSGNTCLNMLTYDV